MRRDNFTFVDYRIIEINFHLKDSFDDSVETIEINPKISLEHYTDKTTGFIVIGVEIDGDNVPFYIDIKLSGQFGFSKEYIEEHDIKKVLHINCAGILFPFLREHIADFTRRAGFPPLLLNPVNFVALYNESKEN